MASATTERQETGEDVLTSDGGIVRLRPVAPTDADALTALYTRGSDESLRLRFFGSPGHGGLAKEIERLVRAPDPDHDALLAEQADGVIGVASYERRPVSGHQAEFAVFVDEAHHGRGVGTLLLEHLSARARQRGVTELIGEALPGNVAMLQVARNLDGRSSLLYSGGVVDMRLATSVDDEALAVADARDRVAQRASLRPLLAPRSVAVVGAGRSPGGIGHATLQSLVEYGFGGERVRGEPERQRDRRRARRIRA